MKLANAERYRKFQNYNSITKLLHSVRFRNVVEFIKSNYKDNQTVKILEIGCADGKLFGLLNRQFNIDYTGIELFDDFVAVARKQYGDKTNFNLIHGSVMNHLEKINQENYDIIISLETLEHIPWLNVIQLLQTLSKSSSTHFLFSIPNELGPAILIKNIGSYFMGYPRYREYSWKQTFYASIYRLDKLPRHHINHIGFDWRWLMQTIRYHLEIRQIFKSPFKFMPSCLSPSFFLICSK